MGKTERVGRKLNREKRKEWRLGRKGKVGEVGTM